MRAEVALSLPEKLFHIFWNRLSELFLSIGSDFSLTSLLCALGVSFVFLIFKYSQRRKRLGIKALARSLLPRRITHSASTVADLGFFFFNVFVFGIIFGWAVLSYQFLSKGVIDVLAATFGAVEPAPLPEFFSRAAITVTIFLAYELGYWIDHYLSHRIPVLWEFHKVHHTASVLTPLTVWRLHPVDSLKFSNILAIVMGIASGFANYLFGETVDQYTISNNNVILVLFVHAYLHLQHSHFWIAFRGVPGRIFLSPAHHQVHHSSDPIHFNKNLGSCLAVWDWLFGTLHIPQKEPEKLSYGVEPDNENAHTVTEGLIAPIWRAGSRIVPMFQGRSSQLNGDGAARVGPSKLVHETPTKSAR